ncbi:hypothetical protein [Streptomyces sp. NPDC004528]|uniref:hypothetical protein n=1 Tax=Streptomyces sp. NPDC004528 TaxID=3154550 RepID=UPI0033B63F6E
MRANRGGKVLARAIWTKLLPLYDDIYPQVIAANEHRRQVRKREADFAERLVGHVPGAAVVSTEPALIVESRGPSIERATVHLGTDFNIVTFKYVDNATTEAVMQAYGAAVRARPAQETSRGTRASRTVVLPRLVRPVQQEVHNARLALAAAFEGLFPSRPADPCQPNAAPMPSEDGSPTRGRSPGT